MAAAIDHPNVIPVYEAGEEDGRLYLVMRWVAGTDLHKLIRDTGRLEPTRARRDRQPGGRSAGRGACRRARASRRQARQRAPQQRPRVPGRLRPHAPRRHGHAADDRRPLPRHRRLHGARSSSTRARTTPARTCTRSAACCSRRSPALRRSCATRSRRRCWRTCTIRRRARRTRPACRAEFDRVIARALAKAPEDRYPSAGDFGRAVVAAAEGRSITTEERSVARGAAAPTIRRDGHLWAGDPTPRRRPAPEPRRRAGADPHLQDPPAPPVGVGRGRVGDRRGRTGASRSSPAATASRRPAGT